MVTSTCWRAALGAGDTAERVNWARGVGAWCVAGCADHRAQHLACNSNFGLSKCNWVDWVAVGCYLRAIVLLRMGYVSVYYLQRCTVHHISWRRVMPGQRAQQLAVLVSQPRLKLPLFAYTSLFGWCHRCLTLRPESCLRVHA
jgi:hypothetical protein